MSNVISKKTLGIRAVLGLTAMACSLAAGGYIGYQLGEEAGRETPNSASFYTINVCLWDSVASVNYCSSLSCSQTGEFVSGLLERMNEECYQTENR